MAQVKLSKAEQRVLDIIRHIEQAGGTPMLMHYDGWERSTLEVYIDDQESTEAVPTYHPINLNTGERFKTAVRRIRLDDGRYERCRVGSMAVASLIVKGLFNADYLYRKGGVHPALSIAAPVTEEDGWNPRQHYIDFLSKGRVLHPLNGGERRTRQIQKILDLIEEQERAEAPKKTETPKVLECVTEQWAHVPGIRCRCCGSTTGRASSAA